MTAVLSERGAEKCQGISCEVAVRCYLCVGVGGSEWVVHFDVGRENEMSQLYVFPVVVTCLQAKLSVFTVRTNRIHYFAVSLYR